MVAIGLLKGNLVAEDYEDDVAKDTRIDALREKMVINEDKRYSKDYLEADKRSIANKIQIHAKDATTSKKLSTELISIGDITSSIFGTSNVTNRDESYTYVTDIKFQTSDLPKTGREE